MQHLRTHVPFLVHLGPVNPLALEARNRKGNPRPDLSLYRRLAVSSGMVKVEWFKTYTTAELPSKFELVFQSWDTANKPTELSDYSVCTTWGEKEKHLFLHVLRKLLGYPDLKRAVREQAEAFGPQTILIEDKASGPTDSGTGQ